MVSTPMRVLLVDDVDASFRLATLERPVPGNGQVLVRIGASGVNPLDIKIRRGNAAHAKHPLPAVIGMDFAGVVEAVGAGVTTFEPGDKVYGLAGGVGGLQGSLAEYAAVDALLLAPMPVRFDMREAAAIPLVFITAWEGLVDRAGVTTSAKVLVQGSGGVGKMAIQIARAYGAEVFATGSDHSQKTIEQLGATAINHTQSSVQEYVADHTAGLGFDIVYDTVGGATLDASFHAVRRFGHVVSCLGWGTHALAPLSFRAATYSGVFSLLPMLTGEGRAHHGAILREATRLAEAGELVARIDSRRFNFESADEAHEAVASRQVTGKIVIDV